VALFPIQNSKGLHSGIITQVDPKIKDLIIQSSLAWVILKGVVKSRKITPG
jgi:hypothetical protein